MTTYQIAIERTDGTLDALSATYTNKATAIRVARFVAKRPSFEGVKIWVDDTSRGVGIFSLPLPKWEG